MARSFRDFLIYAVLGPFFFTSLIFFYGAPCISADALQAEFLPEGNEQNSFHEDFQAGKNAFRKNQLEMAKVFFLKSLEMDKCHPRIQHWILLLAKKFIIRQRLSEAIELYEALVACDPQNIDYHLSLAEIYQKKGELIAAEKTLAKALLYHPGNYRAQIMLGEIYLKEGRLSNAFYLFEDFPCDPQAMDGLRRISERYAAIGEWKKSIAIYQELLFCRPDNMNYGLRLSELLTIEGKFNEALIILENLLRKISENPEIYAAIGKLHFLLNNPFQAEKNYLKALKIKPCFKPALIGLKNLANQFEKFPKWRRKAFGIYQLVSKCDPLLVSKDLYRFSLYQNATRYTRDIIGQLQDVFPYQAEYVTSQNRLGFYYLLHGMADMANFHFRRAYIAGGCLKETLLGLEETAKLWLAEKNYKNAILLYRMLACCKPEDKNYLFLLGRALGLAGRYREAISVLQEAIKQNPYDFDLEVQLGLTYYWQKNYRRARQILERYPEITYARENLGKVELAAENYLKAEKHFRFVLQRKPNNSEARIGLARSLRKQWLYKASKKQYLEEVERHPDDELAWYELYQVKKHTNGSGKLNSSFTMAKEDDPDLNVPVVKTIYLNNSFEAIFPLWPKGGISLEPFLNYQIEKNLIRKQFPNYNVLLPGATLDVFFDINKYFSGDAFFRIKGGRNSGENFFPFDSTTKLEPGSSLSFRKDGHYAKVNGYFASFIIKNFARGLSQLQGIKIWDVSYSYQIDKFYLEPTLGWQFRKIYYEDSLNNREWERNYWVQFQSPIWPEYFSLTFNHEIGAFKKLSPNYNSFRHRRKNILKVQYHREWDFMTFVDIVYERGWKTTEDEVTVLGFTDAFSQIRKVMSHEIRGRIARRIWDRAEISLEGKFYRDTFPYREGKIKGSLEWRF
ncbi:MAG: hypothetical protein Tsb0015_05800 [Simkaniaceae bacterium]